MTHFAVKKDIFVTENVIFINELILYS